MNNISAVMGISNLERREKIIGTHKRNASLYREIFSKNSKIVSLKVEEHMDPSYWIYTVLLDSSVDRDSVVEMLAEKEIHAGMVHVPNHPYDCFENRVTLEHTESFAKHQVCIPCGWWLSEEDVLYIGNSLIELCE